jgi:hypothetical protein
MSKEAAEILDRNGAMRSLLRIVTPGLAEAPDWRKPLI